MAREPRTDERHTRTPEREREVIVTDSGRRSSGVGAVIAAIIGIIVVALIAWFLFAGGFGTGGEESVNVDVPEEVNVDTDGGEGGG